MISEKTNFLILTTVRNITGGFATLQQFASDISDLGSVEQYSLVQHYSNSSRLLIKVPFLQKYLLLITSLPKAFKYLTAFSRSNPHNYIILTDFSSRVVAYLLYFSPIRPSTILFVQAKEWLFFPWFNPLRFVSYMLLRFHARRSQHIFCTTHTLYDFYATIPKLPHLASALTYIYPATQSHDPAIHIPLHSRTYDVCIFFNPSFVKNPSLVLSLLSELSTNNINTTVISSKPSQHINSISSLNLLVNPSRASITRTLSDTRIFICLSTYEGYGLPSLEAMECGCIPILYPNNGTHEYANTIPQCFISRSATAIDIIFQIKQILQSVENFSSLSFQCSDLHKSIYNYHSNLRHSTLQSFSSYFS